MALIPDDGDVTWLSWPARDMVGVAGTGAVLDRSTPGSGEPGTGGPAQVITMLTAAAEQFHLGDTGLRFPRLRLVTYLAGLEPTTRRANAELVDALLDKLREYRSRRSRDSASGPGVISAFQTLNPWPVIVALVAFVAPEFLFRMWFYGAPGLGRECRWLRGQHKILAPDKSFGTFVLGLTGRPRAAGQVDSGLLAIQAFLADLRADYQPRRWRRSRGWRRPCAPILLLDQVGDELPSLLTTARAKLSEPDPLLVIMVAAGQPSESTFPRKSIRVARDEGGEDEEGWQPEPRGKYRGVLRAAGVIGLASLGAVLTLAAVSRSTPQAAACPVPAKSNAMTSIALWTNPGPPRDSECTGYSTTVPFTNRPGVDAGNAEQALQDKRLVYDQRQVFVMDQKAEQLASSRPVLTLVYFAGLTAAPNDDYDSGEAEELEGLLAAQKLAIKETSGPTLNIVVANGGSQMKNALNVARMLVPLFRHHQNMLGVVGLDRSVAPVKQAITLFGQQGIPVVATTLSADGIGGNDPSYFQLVPDNTQEARLILGYVRDGVTEYFEQSKSVYYSRGHAAPTLVWIYYPSRKPGDYYVSSLVADLQQVRRTDPQFRSLPRVVPTNRLGAGLCGADRVIVYAGRHDLPQGNKFNTFANFLRTVAKDCPFSQKDRPFIIADDGVSRFIADPAARFQPGMRKESISYVIKAVALTQTRGKCLGDQATAATVPEALVDFCQAYAGIVTHLRHALGAPGDKVPFLWTDDRVGLAYDAAGLFISAAEAHSGSLITRAQLPAAFKSQPYPGVTGTLNFTHGSHTGSNTPGGMPMAIVRIAVSNRSATPTCEYTSAAHQILGYGPSYGQLSRYLPCPSLSS